MMSRSAGDADGHAVDVEGLGVLGELVVAAEPRGFERDIELTRRRLQVQELHARERCGIARELHALGLG